MCRRIMEELKLVEIKRNFYNPAGEFLASWGFMVCLKLDRDRFFIPVTLDWLAS